MNPNPTEHLVGLKAPSLHGNNGEFGSKDVNLKMSWCLIFKTKHNVSKITLLISFPYSKFPNELSLVEFHFL